ncbi:MAG: hypothetical protein H6828_04845 [Planctomycetes bacterium]|nr:hypothetical protein [Planctomycetota bacterium]
MSAPRLVRLLAVAALALAAVLFARSRGAWRAYGERAAAELGRARAAPLEAERAAEDAQVELAEARQALANARHEAFLTHLAGARDALAERRLVTAARHLDDVPDEHAGWEWGHLDLLRERALPVLCEAPSDVSVFLASDDGERLIVGTVDGELLSVATRDGAVEELAAEHESAWTALALEGERLWAADEDGALWVLEDAGPRHVEPSVFEGERVLSLAGHARLGVLAGFTGGLVCYLDPRTRLWRERARHDDDVGAVYIAPSGELAASASDDGLVREYCCDHLDVERDLEGHADWVRALTVLPWGPFLISGDDAGVVLQWSLLDPPRRSEVPGAVRALSARTGEVSFFTDRGHAQLVDGSGVVTAELDVEGWGEPVARFFVRDGRTFLALARGAEVRVLGPQAPTGAVSFAATASEVRALAQSPDGAWIAAASLGGEVVWLDGATAAVARRTALGGAVLAVAFDASSARLAAGTRAGEVVVWSCADGAELARLDAGLPVSALALSRRRRARAVRGLGRRGGVGERRRARRGARAPAGQRRRSW